MPRGALGALGDTLGMLLGRFSEVGRHSANRCPSAAKTYFLRVRAVSGAPNDVLGAHMGSQGALWGLT